MARELIGLPLPNVPEINPFERFSLTFEKPITSLDPQQIIAEINRRFNSFNIFRKGLYEFGAGRDRHNAALERVGAVSYGDYERRGTRSFNALNRAVIAAQPFTDTNLGFILELASDEGSYADTERMLKVWETEEESHRASITKTQKDVLRGKFSLRPQPVPLPPELTRGHLYYPPTSREDALRSTAIRFNDLSVEANETVTQHRIGETRLILMERAQLIVDLPRVLELEGLKNIPPLTAEVMRETLNMAIMAREALESRNTFGLRVLLIDQGSRVGDPNDLDSLIERVYSLK